MYCRPRTSHRLPAAGGVVEGGGEVSQGLLNPDPRADSAAAAEGGSPSDEQTAQEQVSGCAA